MLKSAKSVVGGIQPYRHLHNMSLPQLNGVAPAAHTITNLKRWSVAGKEIPGNIYLLAVVSIVFGILLFYSLTPRLIRRFANKDNPCL